MSPVSLGLERRRRNEGIQNYRNDGLLQSNRVRSSKTKSSGLATYEHKSYRSEESARYADRHSLHMKIHEIKLCRSLDLLTMIVRDTPGQVMA